MANNKYIGIHPNDLNRTRYGEIVLYVEGEPVGFFSSSGDFVISGSLGIEGIVNVSASIAAASAAGLSDSGSFMITGSVSGDTITFTKGDGSTFPLTITNVTSASYAATASFVLSSSYAVTASYAATASNVSITNDTGVNAIRYLTLVDTDSISSGNDNLKASSALRYLPLTGDLTANTFRGDLEGTASYSSYAVLATTASNALSMSFDGNRPITQTLIPDLVNYNPGTTDVNAFLEKVFYPEAGFGIEILVNEPLSILESFRSGSYIWANSVGYPNYSPLPIGKFTANTAVTWSLQTNNLLAINPTTGELSLKVNLSGSTVYTAPTTFQGTAIATAVAGGVNTRAFTVSILEAPAPSINRYFPLAVNNIFTTGSSANLGEIQIQDNPGTEYSTGIYMTSGGVDIDKFDISLITTTSPTNKTYRLKTTQVLNSGSYTFNVTASNEYGNSNYTEYTITVEENTGPVINSGSFGGTSNLNKDVGLVASGSAFGTLGVSDLQQGYIPPGIASYGAVDQLVSFTLTGTDASKFRVEETAYFSDASKAYSIFFKETPTVGSYNLTASAVDSFGNTTNVPLSSNIVYASAPTTIQLLPSTNFYIIESALSGSAVTTATTGVAGTLAYFSTNQPVSWSLSDPSGIFHISGSSNQGYLSIKADLSGSAYQHPQGISIDVTATNPYGLTKSRDNVLIQLVDNLPATITGYTVTQHNYYTKDGGAGFGTVRVYDTQGAENVQLINIGGPDGAYFTTSSESPGLDVYYTVSSSVALNSGSYIVGFTASDGYGQITTHNVTYTVAPDLVPTIDIYAIGATLPTSTLSLDYADATSGSDLGHLFVRDGDSGIGGIASFTLTGTDSSKFNAFVSQTLSDGYKYTLQPTENLLAATFNLTGSAVDGFGHTTNKPIRINLSANAPSAPESNDPFYIIESAVSGAAVVTNSDGFGGTQGQFTTNQTVTWSLSSGTYLAIDSNGRLSAKVHISGSSKVPGNTITDFVTATNSFGVASQVVQFSVLVVNDEDPVITNTIAGKNNNKTTTATGFGTITISDPQSLGNVSLTDFNGPDVGDFTFSAGTAGSTRVYTVSSSAALNSGSYSFSVTGSDAYNQIAKAAFTITVAENLPPTLAQSGFTKTVFQATNGATIGTIVAADPQDDSIASFNLSGTDSSKFTAVLASSTATSKTYNINATEDLGPSSYNLTASATDSFGLSVTEPVPVTISAQDPVIVPNNTLFYIIESALSGSQVRINPNGYSGTQADMNADQAVTWSIKSPSTYLAIDTAGGLTVKTNISGSAKSAVTGSDFIGEYVVATNAYGGSSELLANVKVALNEPPALTYTGLTVASGSANLGDTVGTVTATDPQSLDTITSVVISGGDDAAKFTLALSGSTSYSKTYNINTTEGLAASAYEIELTATDSFNKTTVETKTITVQAVGTAQVYVYSNNSFASYLNTQKDNATALLYGLGYQTSTGQYSPSLLLGKFISGSLGTSTISMTLGANNFTATLRQSGTVGDLLDVKSLGAINSNFGVGEQVVIVFPSSSAALDSLPSAMFQGAFQGTVFNPPGGTGQHGLINYSSTPPYAVQAGVHYFTLQSPVGGHSDWGVVYTYDAPTSNTEYTVAAYGDTLP